MEYTITIEEIVSRDFEIEAKSIEDALKIADGAYKTMIERIASAQNPDLFVMTYSENLSVTNMLIVPKFFFVPAIIEKRQPLQKNCPQRRLGRLQYFAK